MSDADVMRLFESFGDNCEFGFAQRAAGAEPPLSLFRWASTEIIRLMRILDDDFAGFSPEYLEVSLIHNEWVLHNPYYELWWHTFANGDEIDEAAILRRERRRIEMCVEAMIGHLKAGDRIFVVKRNHPLPLFDIDRLVKKMRRYGPSTLLWVDAQPDRAGTSERLADGLLRGFIPAFADPARVTVDTDAAAWLLTCRAALEVHHNTCAVPTM